MSVQLIKIVCFVNLSRYCFSPIGKSLGIKNTRTKKAAPNEILEKAYRSRKIKHKQVSSCDFLSNISLINNKLLIYQQIKI